MDSASLHNGHKKELTKPKASEVDISPSLSPPSVLRRRQKLHDVGDFESILDASPFLVLPDDEPMEAKNEVEEWLERVGMAQYWETLRAEGFDSMDMLQQIKDKADLDYVGVRLKAHQMKLMNEINLLKRDEACG